MKEEKTLSKPEALEKLRTFCSYQERNSQQVKQKMYRLGIDPDWVEELLLQLQEEGLLNHQRYAQTLARGKSRGRGWGPAKIRQRLLADQIGKPEIEKGLMEADFSTALAKLTRDATRKHESLKLKNDPAIKPKMLRFCLSRGFDMQTALQLLRAEFNL